MKQDSTFGKILIIDDERDNTEIIKDILEDVSYTTMLARSAIEAKAIIAAMCGCQGKMVFHFYQNGILLDYQLL